VESTMSENSTAPTTGVGAELGQEATQGDGEHSISLRRVLNRRRDGRDLTERLCRTCVRFSRTEPIECRHAGRQPRLLPRLVLHPHFPTFQREG
jgi:hypothetical protein